MKNLSELREAPTLKTIEFKDILSIAFKLTDYLNFQWNFYVVFNLAIIGWLFSSSQDPWSWQKKLIVSAFYLFFVLISIVLIRSTFWSLLAAVDELALASNEVEFRSEKWSGLLRISKPFNKELAITFHITADLIVLLAIWTRDTFL